MGKPTYLDRNQVTALEAASALEYEELKLSGDSVVLYTTAKAESVTIYKIDK